MLNQNIMKALKIIQHEVSLVQKSTDRYCLMEDIQEQIELIRKNKAVVSQSESLEAIADIISSKTGTARENILGARDLEQSEIEHLYKFDNCDWIEMIMELEDKFDLEIPTHFESRDTTLGSLVNFIDLKYN
ncbi:hypothetical protein [Escherichia phage vB_EcoM_JNE01]|nr:hypothetical protein [Escherichia phage vB_EcoM_JNE01]